MSSLLRLLNKIRTVRIRKGFIQTGNTKENSISIGAGRCANKINTLEYRNGADHNHIEIGDNFSYSNLKITFTGNHNKLVIGDNVKWSGFINIVGHGLTETIGSNSTGISVMIVCRDENVTIGSGCLFSRDVEIRSNDVHKIYALGSTERINKPGPVVIGDRVWIAAKVTVSKGVTIQHDSVISGFSFVNRSIEEPNVVIAGTPARIVTRGIHWKR